MKKYLVGAAVGGIAAYAASDWLRGLYFKLSHQVDYAPGAADPAGILRRESRYIAAGGAAAGAIVAGVLL